MLHAANSETIYIGNTNLLYVRFCWLHDVAYNIPVFEMIYLRFSAFRLKVESQIMGKISQSLLFCILIFCTQHLELSSKVWLQVVWLTVTPSSPWCISSSHFNPPGCLKMTGALALESTDWISRGSTTVDLQPHRNKLLSSSSAHRILYLV